MKHLTKASVIWLVFCAFFPVSAAAAQERPNILVVLLDDAGFMDFGAYGSDTKTPNIDRLAQNGVMFSRYYTTPMCGPSRAMLLTGMDNHQVGMGTLVETVTPAMHGLPGYSMVWDDSQQTIASRLSDAGYQTFVSGKWGVGKTGANLPDRFGFDKSFVMDSTGGSNYDHRPYLPGYDEVKWFEDGEPVRLPEDYYSSRNLVDKLINYIDEGNPEQPFFGFLAFQALHIPVQVSQEYIERYNGVFDAGWDVMREQRLQKAIELGLVPPTTRLAPSPEHHRAWDELPPEEQAYRARLMQVNAGMMEAADYHFGRLLSHLQASGQLENTLIVVTSDNGAEAATTVGEPGVSGALLDMLMRLEGHNISRENIGQPGSLASIGPEWASVSSAPFQFYKFTAGEGGLRVPLVIAGPGIETAGLTHARAHVADLVPTLLDAAGVAYDADGLYGRSLMPVLRGDAENVYGQDDSFGFEVSGNAALYRGNWKLVRVSKPLGDSGWRLYDLSADPGETTDLSAKNPALFDDMLAEYRSYSSGVGVVELGPDEYATKQLARNLAVKVAKKHWYLLLGAILLLAVLVYGVIRAVRRSKVQPETS